MTDKISAPCYALRGLQLIGWRDMQHALDFLFADGQMKSGTLVAINADGNPYDAHFDAGCGQAVDMITGAPHDFGGGSTLEPYSCHFWKCER